MAWDKNLYNVIVNNLSSRRKFYYAELDSNGYKYNKNLIHASTNLDSIISLGKEDIKKIDVSFYKVKRIMKHIRNDRINIWSI